MPTKLLVVVSGKSNRKMKRKRKRKMKRTQKEMLSRWLLDAWSW